MPKETSQAIKWALKQKYYGEFGEEYAVTKETSAQLVDHVRQYFNDLNVEYNTFSYNDLLPYLD